MNVSPLTRQPGLERLLGSKTVILAACASIVAVDLLLYWKSLGLYFIQDDFYCLWFTSSHSVRGFIKLFTEQHVFYRPISTYLYFFILQAGFGTSPFPYHLSNLLIHAFNSLATGYLVYLMTRNRVVALVSAAIFTSRVGHVIAIYWICVTTQSMPLAFFLLSLILYIHYLENGRLAVLIASYLSFALCAFSNINGPTLVALITLYDMLVRRDRSVRSILKNESGFYLIVAAFLYLQFGVFGYNPPQDYRVSIGLLALRNFGILNLFAYNSLYVASYLAGAPPAMLAAGVLAGVTTMWVAISAFLRGVRNGLRQEGRLYLFFGFWYVWGFLPYLPLSEHVWPQYITASAVGLSFLSAALLTRFLKPKMLAASLCVILAVSFFSVRLFEREEFETRGIIYKSALARNVVSDLKQAIEQRPEAETIIVLDGKVELWWILHYGRNAEVFTGKNRPIFYMRTGQEIPAGPKSLVLRFDNMRLHRVQ